MAVRNPAGRTVPLYAMAPMVPFGPQAMERRLRLSDKDRKILLESLRLYFQVKAPRHEYDARAAYKLAFAIYMTRTGRRRDYAFPSTNKEMLCDLREWEREVTYKPKPLTPEQQAEADKLAAMLRR